MTHSLGFRVLRAFTALGGVMILSAPVASYAGSQRVTMPDLKPSVGVLHLQNDPLEKEKVEYQVTGKDNYDDFFRSSALLQGGMVVSQAASDSLTVNLKNYARTYASSKATDQNVKAIVGNSKPEDLKEDQALALLRLKKKQGELSADEKSFATNSVADAAVLLVFLAKTPDQANTLVEQGTGLTGSVSSDFSGFNAMKAPGVTSGLSQSITNLKGASTKAPELAKSLARLSEGLKTLL